MIFFAHPKQCFLNDTILLSTSQKEAVTVEIQGVDTQCYTITEERSISIQLSAGTYKLVGRNENNDTSVMTVEVFNAIRLGSPSHLKSYIFDNNPWILLIKSDRTIFYNREDRKQYYENFITPEKVNELNSDLLLFENNATQGFWIFSTQLQQIIYSDENSSVKTFNSYQIIYEKDKSIYMLPLENFKEIKTIGNIDADNILLDNTTGCAFAFRSKNYRIDLYCSGKEHFISEKGFLSLISPHFAIFQDKSIIKILNLLEFPNSDIDNIITTKNGKQISIEYQAPKTTEHLPINSKRYASYIIQAQSKTGRFTLRKKDSAYAWVHEPENEDIIPIFHCFTIQSESVAKVTDALFTDDENIVLCKQEKDYKLYDLSRDEYSPFPNSDFVVRSVNGYNPIVQIKNSYLGKPVLIDPVTLQHVKQEDLAQYTFKSPSSRYILEKGELYYSKLNERNITKAELLKDENVLANGLYVNDSSLSIEIPIDNEKTYKEKWHDCIPMLVQKYESFLREELSMNETSSTKDIEQHLRDLTPERWNDLFYDEVIIIKDTKENHEVLLRLKGILWFLNYVSFSYDDEYVAVVGRYHNYSFSGGYYGIFQTKDGSKLNEITNWGINSIYAAWVCAFTRDNKSAFYTSEPHTYLLKDIESHTISSQRIERKNFLCFSPDGKYMALSEQGYKCGFGHRRSTQVFIYSLDTNQMTQLPCYLGGSVKGLNRNRNVAACMFSQNNDRLLVSSDDGIVIVYALNGSQTFYHNKSLTNISFGEEYTQEEYVEKYGEMHLRKIDNDGNIRYTLTFGGKYGLVGKSVRDALNNGERLKKEDLGVVMMSSQSISPNGTIGKIETKPMLFLQPHTQKITNETYGKRYTLSQYEAENGTCQLSVQANNDGKEVIVCTINGEKAFVDDEVKYAIAHGGVLHKDDLAILMMNYEETSEDGTIS